MHIANYTPKQLVPKRVVHLVAFLAVWASVAIVFLKRQDMLARMIITVGAVWYSLQLVFNYGCVTREYIADTEGITAIWFKKLRKSYSWSEFEIVQSYTVRTYSGPEKWILCSRIPVKEIFEGETTSYWVQGRPFQVLYMFKMPDEKEREFFSYLPQKFTQPDTGTKGE